MATKKYYKPPVGQLQQFGYSYPSGYQGATANRAPWAPPKITPAVGQSFLPQQQYATPDWGALVGGDPEFIGAEGEMNQMNQSDRSNLRDAIRRAVIGSGFKVGPDEDVDAATQAAAAGNQFSTAADIASQLRRGAATSDAQLASRGLLDSGQFTENRSQLQTSADQATAQGTAALLDSIASGRTGYTNAVQGRAAQLRQLRAAVAARLSQNPGIWQSNPSTYGDVFAPLGNASAQQMWNAINLPSVRKQNQGIINQGYDAFLRNYGSQFGGGGGGAAPAPVAGGGAPSITGYEWRNGVQYAVMSDGTRQTAAQLGARF